MVPVRRPGRPLTSCPHLSSFNFGCSDPPKSTVPGPRIDWTLAESSNSREPVDMTSTSTPVRQPSSSPPKNTPPSGGPSSSTNEPWQSSSPGERLTPSKFTWDTWQGQGSPSPPSHNGRDQSHAVVLTTASSSQTPWSAAADPAQPFSNRLSGSSSYEAWMPLRNRESTQISEFGAIDEDTFGDIDQSSLPNDTTSLGPEWDDSFGVQTSLFGLPPFDHGSDPSHHDWPAI
ncbi:hypothetical protein QBC39DRAFT_116658 [Podospora conica]|nr:hypothetical protein QBC39DRAFT_116658 [Schizothecium conicum]